MLEADSIIFVPFSHTQKIWSLAIVDTYHHDSGNRFPKSLLFGASSSSYQVEGAWNEGGKSQSIWDNIFHVQNRNKQEKCWVADCSDGDKTTNSYHLYKRDVQMLKETRMDHYRFSISWPRILPSGFPNEINLEGVKYYNNLINELLKNDIKPMVTLYHWDLPQSIQDLGGWTNPLIVEWFEDYSRIVYNLFGDRVKYWITINEPMMICQMGYGDDIFAPALKSYGIGNYICFKNVLLAHAKAWYIYDEEFRNVQDGKVGISISMMWYEPLTDSDSDKEAAEDMRAFENWPADPIFSERGDFSETMKSKIAARSKEQGFPKSRLPKLSIDDIEFIHGTSDFFGLNAYSTYAAYNNGSLTDTRETDYNVLLGRYVVPSFADDLNISLTIKPEYKPSHFFTNYPPGFYRLLKYIKEKYQNPEIFITENGIPTGPGLDDEIRVSFIKGHMRALMKAINDGVNVIGYTFWSLMDSFEWNSGYTLKFGLYEVDFNDTSRPRVPKKSAKVYAEIIRQRTVLP